MMSDRVSTQLIVERGPSRAGDLSLETRGLRTVPETERHGPTWRIATVWFSANMVPPTFFVGTLAAADFIGLGFAAGLAAIILGNLIGATLQGLMATMGPRTGMSQLALGRLSFGRANLLPAILNSLSMVAWTAIGTLFGAAAFSLLTTAPFWLSALAVVVPMTAIVTIGYEAILQFQKYMAFVLAAVFVFITVRVAQVGDFSSANAVEGPQLVGSFLLMTTIAASFAMGWAVFASDYTRYLPASVSGKSVFFWSAGGLAVACTWLEVLGLAVAHLIRGNSVATLRDDVLGGGVLGVVALVAIFLGSISVNSLNTYTGSLSLLTAGIRIPRPVSAVALAAVAFGCTVWLSAQAFDVAFTNFLLLLSYWIAPFSAVVLTDWFLRGRRADPQRIQEVRSLDGGLVALAAFLIGLLASVPFMNTALWVGPAVVLLQGGDIAYYVGFFVAGAAYWAGVRIWGLPKHKGGAEKNVLE